MDKGVFSDWAERINWKNRVASLCKPCWELKYCPYGPIVEHFPLSKERTDKSCRIFGHDCPVFYSAEPFTETKELRRVSRYIPREIQFKVVKRDNQICQQCKKNVLDKEIEFDHIIPYSKGGPTEEHNIRLLCSECNKKKKDQFEERYLVKDLSELICEPIEIDFIRALLGSIRFFNDFVRDKARAPGIEDFQEVFSGPDKDDISDIVMSTVQKAIELLSKENEEFFEGNYECMQYRWGLLDGKIHGIKQTLAKYNISSKTLFELEVKFVNHIGWYIERTEKDYKKWLKL